MLFVRHAGSRTLFRWQVDQTAEIVGFNLFRGTHQLNRSLVRVHTALRYHYTVRHAGHGPYTLHIVLTDGREIVVPSS